MDGSIPVASILCPNTTVEGFHWDPSEKLPVLKTELLVITLKSDSKAIQYTYDDFSGACKKKIDSTPPLHLSF